MRNTTLCYIKKDNRYLFIHRTKKENDENKDKFIAPGGKFEYGESPEDCAIREVYEETGLKMNSYLYKGIVTFVSDVWGTEYMHLFLSEDFSGEVKECDEGDLLWVEGKKVNSLYSWEGDKIFFNLIEGNFPFFSLKLNYKGEELTRAVLNGKELKLPFKEEIIFK